MHDTSEHSSAEQFQPQAKRQKTTTSLSSTAHFWDSLSKVWLTKQALNELNRRNRSVEPIKYYLSSKGHRPLTRRLLSELRRDVQLQNTPASDLLKACSQAELRNIQAFARHGGPDLSHLSGYPSTLIHYSHETMVSSLSTQQRGCKRRALELEPSSYLLHTSTKQSRSAGAYDPNFQQRMIDSGIYPYGYTYSNNQRPPPKPHNWEEIQKMLKERRPSLSSSQEERYDQFVLADNSVSSESRAIAKVIPKIQGTVQVYTDGDILFNNLADIMPRPSHKVKPDLYYGSRPDQLHSSIRDKLQAFIIPSTKQTRPLAPNFFVEAKQPSGSALVALNQTCFAGAIGTRGIHSLQTYGEQTPKYDNNAYTLSATYHSGTLKIYSHHIAQPYGPGTRPEYYMHQLKAWALTGDKEMFIEGIAAFRNAESWTEAQRDAAINHANTVIDNADATVDNVVSVPWHEEIPASSELVALPRSRKKLFVPMKMS